MQKIPPSRLASIMNIAASMGILSNPEYMTTGKVLSKNRGPAPAGYHYVTGVFTPGGPNRNCEPAIIRNPKIAAHVSRMHNKWLFEQSPSRVTKK